MPEGVAETQGMIITTLETQHLLQEDSKRDYIVKVSFIEIYKEELKDLLDSESSAKDVNIREDSSGNTGIVNDYFPIVKR